MRIMKFEGATMRDAVAKVKQELGDQAVIVATRQIRRGLIGGTAYEISAAIEDDAHVLGPTSGGPLSAYGSPPPLAPFATAPAPAPTPRDDAELEKLMAPLRSELRSLRALVRASGDSRSTTELRGELASLRKLVENLAPNVVATPAPAPTSRRATPSLALTQPSAARAILLVGPTGAGKTTTIAKLAARAALIEGRTVHLVTLDDYRIGGVDQIRTFAELIGIPLHVAPTQDQLRELCEDEGALTLIDTAGRSPRDTRAIAELAELVEGLPVETHLVVPAALSPVAIDDFARRYRALAPARLLFTKLDEVEEVTELAAAPARLALPVTWVTTGQAVPEDLEEPTTARLLELAAGGLHSTTKTASKTRAA